jgi:hypothetical protein
MTDESNVVALFAEPRPDRDLTVARALFVGTGLL